MKKIISKCIGCDFSQSITSNSNQQGFFCRIGQPMLIPRIEDEDGINIPDVKECSRRVSSINPQLNLFTQTN